MRLLKPSPGEHYHIFNRGMSKQDIFFDDYDRARFLFLILYFQSAKTFQNIGRQSSYFVKHRVFNIEQKDLESVVGEQQKVSVLNFCFMPNHFHVLLKELTDGGIATYMQRVLNSYTKYYNAKYQKSGHLFQGPYQIVHIEDDRQLLYLSAYIHKNPTELNQWRNQAHLYEWSSFQDFISTNRFERLLERTILLEQFENVSAYRKFVLESTAKEPLNC